MTIFRRLPGTEKLTFAQHLKDEAAICALETVGLVAAKAGKVGYRMGYALHYIYNPLEFEPDRASFEVI